MITACPDCEGRGTSDDESDICHICNATGEVDTTKEIEQRNSKSRSNAGVMCRCEDVQIGSYGNQLWVHPPSHMPKDNGYCLDRCIAEEVMQLWMKRIITTGCCCGHGKVASFIGVIDQDIPKMKELGYEVAPNKDRPYGEDSFYAKGT